MSGFRPVTGGVAAVLAGAFMVATGMAQTPASPDTIAASQQGESSQSASSTATTPAGSPKAITVVGVTNSRTGSNIRAVGMPDMLPGGLFALNDVSASSCGFMAEYGSMPYIGSETSPFGSAAIPSISGQRRYGSCSQSDMNFAAGRASIARRDHSLKDAFAAFDAEDYPKAFDLFKASFNKMGYPTAALMAGRMSLYGIGTAQNVAEGVNWLKKAAAYPPRNRRTGEADFNRDNAEPRDASTDAVMLLGHIHLYGLYVAQDFEEARKWYSKANGWGFAPAGDILGQIHLKGYGVPISARTAFTYFKKAAEINYGPAQYHLGLLYYSGAEGVATDRKLAMEWFYAASKNSVPGALYVMARAYDTGEGIAADPQKAIVYYKEAALKGQADAQNALGTYFYKGEIVTQDIATARKWFEAAAKQGHVDGMFNLAVMYYRGEGGDKDLVMAYVWFSLAGVRGHPEADAAVKIIEPQLTPEQRSKADAILNPPPAKP